VDLRPATEADLPHEFDVFEQAERELYERRGAEWARRDFSAWERLHRHLLRHDGARCIVAENSGRLIGFTAAWAREDVWFLSALFVLPEWQGRGIGKRLLNLAWGEGYRRRVTITEALQPVSTASYARRGLIPTTPILAFEGEPQSTDPEQLEPAAPDPDALRFLDHTAYGFDRGVDHLLWTETADSTTLWLADEGPAAYSYRRPNGAIGPLAGRDETTAAIALRAELARSTGHPVTLAIPGSAAQLAEAALEAGLRMKDPGLLLLWPPAHPPRSLAIHGDWLF
jgi:GNAT superfamily N-acetyltransferase